MKPEIILLLSWGLEPKEVAKILNIDIHSVYYYNRQLVKGQERLFELLTGRKKEKSVTWKKEVKEDKNRFAEADG